LIFNDGAGQAGFGIFLDGILGIAGKVQVGEGLQRLLNHLHQPARFIQVLVRRFDFAAMNGTDGMGSIAGDEPRLCQRFITGGIAAAKHLVNGFI